MNVSKGKLASVAVGAFLMMFCNGIINNSTTYFTLSVTEYLGCTKTAFSIYFSIITVCAAVMSLVVSGIIARIGLRRGMLLGCLVVSGGFLLLSQLRSLWMVYTAAVLIGVFQSFLVVPTVGVINAWFQKSSSVTGFAMSASGFGGFAMGLIMPSVVEKLNWRTGYLVCAGIFFLVSATACVLAGGPPPRSADTASSAKAGAAGKGAEDRATYRRLLCTPGFWLLMLTALITGGASMISQHFSVLLTMRGYPVGIISVVMGSLSIALAVAKILEGILCDHAPVKLFVPAVFFTGTVSYLAFLSRGTPMLLIGILCYGCSAAGCTVLYPIVMRRLYGRELATATWGICWAAFMVSHAIWTPFYAGMYDLTGSYDAGLLVAAALMAFASAVLLIMLSRKEKEAPTPS